MDCCTRRTFVYDSMLGTFRNCMQIWSQHLTLTSKIEYSISLFLNCDLKPCPGVLECSVKFLETAPTLIMTFNSKSDLSNWGSKSASNGLRSQVFSNTFSCFF